MPRDPSGNFTLVPSYFAQAGQTIRTEQHNPPLEDVAQAISASLARDGRGGMLGPLDMGTFPMRNLAPGESASDAATVGQASVPIGTVVDYAGAAAPAGWFFCAGQALSRTSYPALFTAIGTTYGAGDGSTTFNLPDLRGRVVAGKDDMGGTDATRLSAFFGAVARTLGGVLGTASHVLTLAQLAAHNHQGVTAQAGSHNHGGLTGGAGQHSHSGTTSTEGSHTHTYQRFTVQAGSGVQGGSTASQSNATASTDPAGDHAHTFITSSIGDHQHAIATEPTHAHNIATQGSDEAHPNAQPTAIMNKIIKATL